MPAVHAFTSTEIALVESSFRKLSRQADDAAALFFARLFEFAPVLRAVSRTDLPTQRREFIRLLGTIVHRLDCYEVLRDHLRDAAEDHPDFFGREAHHHAIGAAFFWMLEQVLGGEFTPAVYAAWMTVFHALSEDVRNATRDLALAS